MILFLIFFIKKGSPILFRTTTLVDVLRTILFIHQKLFSVIYMEYPCASSWIFHNMIFFAAHKFINRSGATPPTIIFKYPRKKYIILSTNNTLSLVLLKINTFNYAGNLHLITCIKINV